MPSPLANAEGISSALAELLRAAQASGGGSPYFQAVYEGMPQGGFQAQSPVAVIDFESIAPRRLTMGAGRNQDIWTWLVDVYIDKTQQSSAVAYASRLVAVDVLRTTLHAHVTLGINDPSSSILAAYLDGTYSRPDLAHEEGLLYSNVHFRLAVAESYTTAIGP